MGEAADGQQVVVGFDGSDPSKAAVRWAAGEAQRRGASLLVVCADDADRGPAPLGSAAWLVESGERMARDVAEDGAALAGQAAPGLSVSASSMRGSAAAALVEASQSAALVVTGTGGRHRLTGEVLGSVAFTVTSHAISPVVVVRRDAGGDPRGPVVVGVDGSGPAQRALEAAAVQAQTAGVPLRVICTWSTPAADLGAPGRSGAAHGDPVVRAAQDAATQVAQQAAEDAGRRHDGLEVEVETPHGPPGPALVDASQGAALVVVGSRGHGGFASLLLGSVSHEVLSSAHCPVMVLPRHAHGEHAG